jgi:hypothetical protein
MMVKDRRDHRFAVDLGNLQGLAEGKVPLTAQPFRHQDLFGAIQTSPVIEKKALINTLHHIHFTNGAILLHVSDPRHREDFLVGAHLDDCPPGEITCRWPDGAPAFPEDADFPHVIFSDGLSLILLPIKVTARQERGFTAALAEKGHLLGKRLVRRHACSGIGASLTQSGFLARGDLIDFSPLAFRVRLKPDANGSFIWFNKDSQITISLAVEERVLFSGPCRCIRQTGGLFERELVLAPQAEAIHRFQKKRERNPRLQITPTPALHFEHPLFGQPFQREIHDLTFAGFAVTEKAAEGVLMPGLIIPACEIRYAGALKMTCDAQVIYRRQEGKDRVRCGLAILDMDFRSYRLLSHIMVHAADPQARFSNEMEMDALWEFFFDTGFIYPKKYQLIQSSRDQFKETYRRLYRDDQEIEAHFTYQENDKIYGHVAIFRAYQRAWMVHHLAARALNGRRTGLSILKNILRFFDGLYRYPSIRIDHMIFYFRPENHFPNLFFGGFARDLNDQRACSLDLFAYLSHPQDKAPSPFPEGWQLTRFEPRHLPELERYYRNASGGLLLDVLRLGQTDDGNETLEEVYRRHGFVRQWRVHALLRGESLKAVLIVNRSSLGLNLSELLNSIKVLVTDPAGLPWNVLAAALARLTPEYPTESVPLMIYPDTYPCEQGIKVDKRYLLWILDTQYGKDYLEYMEKKTKLSLRLVIRHLLRKMVPK